eukprot:3792152-Rhodomonas_salina.1
MQRGWYAAGHPSQHADRKRGLDLGRRRCRTCRSSHGYGPHPTTRHHPPACVQGSRFSAQGSRFSAQGSWFGAQCVCMHVCVCAGCPRDVIHLPGLRAHGLALRTHGLALRAHGLGSSAS